MIDTNASPTGTVGLIAKQARELGYKGYFISSTAVLEAKALVNVAGKGADNIVAYRIWSAAPTKLYDQIAERHMAKYKEATLGTVWEAYAATRWVVEAVQKAGTFDTKKVAEQLANSTFQFHPYGPASWGGDKTYGAKRQIQTPFGCAHGHIGINLGSGSDAPVALENMMGHAFIGMAMAPNFLIPQP